MKEIKVIHKHKKNCPALRQVKDGWWDTPWMIKDTYHKGWKYCVRIICNSTDCKGELRVFASVIEKQFNDLALDDIKETI